MKRIALSWRTPVPAVMLVLLGCSADLPLPGRAGYPMAEVFMTDPSDSDATEAVDLEADPFDDDLAAELAARRPVRLTSRATLFIGGAVLIIAGFLGGVLVQKNMGNTPTSGVGDAANARGGAGGAGQGGAGGFGQGGAGQGGTGQPGGVQSGATSGTAATGTVKLVDGTTVYVTTADGQVVTVKTSSSTAVRVQQSGALSDLSAGATVTVQGTTGADGVITATQVTGQK